MSRQTRFTLSRRQFSFLLGSSVLASPIFASTSSELGEAPLFLSAASDSNDQHWLLGFSVIDGQANLRFKHQLSARAHQIAVNEAKGVFIVVARRPGTYLVFGDLKTGAIVSTVSVPEGRHLLGHGVFSTAGEYFYTTESDFQDLHGDSGRIGVWAVSALIIERIKEFKTNGVGPHELLLMPDQESLVVANGGIRTHPDTGREKLNLDTMLPSLAYLNVKTGQILEQHFLPEVYHQASIRHLDVTQQGKVVLAMQYEGEAFNAVPLLMTHRQGENFKTLSLPLQEQQQMKQYVGSVKFDTSGRFIAASCPKGNRITFWDAQAGEYIKSIRSRDGCGIYATEQGFIFTAGTGRISHYKILQDELSIIDNPLQETQDKVFWDNHLSLSYVQSV